MKALLIIPVTALLMSCGSQKAVIDESSNEQNENAVTHTENPVQEEQINIDGNYRIIGVVHLEDGCGVYIEAETAPGEMKKLYPVNLEDQFKVEAAKIKFDYALSRAMLPAGCIADMTVSVSDVTRLRN